MINIFSHYVPGKLIVLAVLEAAVLTVAAEVGISLRFAHFGTAFAPPAGSVSMQAAAFAIGMMAILSGMGLYQLDLSSNSRAIRVRLVTAFLLCFMLAALVSSLLPSLYPGLGDLSATVVALALAGCLVVRAAFHRWYDASAFKPRVLVLGTGSRVARLAEYALRNPNHEVVGYLSLQPSKHFVPEPRVLSLAPGDSLPSIVEKLRVNQVVVAVRDRRAGGFPLQQLLECKMKGIKIVELPTFFEREYRQVLLESLNPSWMVLGDGFRHGLVGNFVKRLFDLVVGAALLVLLLPVMLVTMLAIFLESGGPVLFRQERVGRDGRAFTLYKFRSMKNDAESHGNAQWAAADDARTTRVGRFIRKYRIDELPQIMNVLRGEMSFVGPRPERPYFVDQLSKKIPYYALRHSAMPGITGWAQVRYSYGGSVDDAVEKLQYDLYYVKNRSLFLDLLILISTVEVVLWGKGAR
jgi:sugar transferase (PEP-CTERM system associated)